eukprot:874137-Pyramimonas_sp.AAC.1
MIYVLPYSNMRGAVPEHSSLPKLSIKCQRRTCTKARSSKDSFLPSPGVDCRPAMWPSVGREYTSNIRWNIRNVVR